MRFLTNSIGTFAAVLFASSSYAALIIDQNQANFPAYMAAFNQGDLAQSFQQTINNIAGAGIRMQVGVGTTDTVTISLWDALPNQFGANMLASASGVATAGSFFDVFWTPAAITPGVTYFLEFTSLNDTLGIAGDDETNPYAFGQVYANPGFESFPDFDYTFRTYYETNQQVPEPASLALLGIGLAGLAAARRRKLMV